MEMVKQTRLSRDGKAFNIHNNDSENRNSESVIAIESTDKISVNSKSPRRHMFVR